MNRARWIVLLLAASFVLASHSQAVAKVFLACSDGSESVRVLNLADLRSAFLLRAGSVHYDAAEASPKGIRRQLQRHFDTVIGLLELSTQRSVEIALDRLEAERGSHWSPRERAAERERVLASRLLQIERLLEYRDHGLFPQNEGQSGGAVPIFVDRHDTACAVGQLMRLSGWQDAVAAVERSNNLVYVPDAAKSVVDRWVLQSGLTLEEAALIQPGYQFLGAYNFAQYGPGGATIENNGLRYANFQLDSTPPPVAGGLGVNTGAGPYVTNDCCDSLAHSGTSWVVIGGIKEDHTFPFDDALGGLAAGSGPGGALKLFTVRFDVSTIAANDRINAFSQSSFQYIGGFRGQNFSQPNAPYSQQTTVRDGGNDIATLLINQDTIPFGYSQKQSGAQFAPRKAISVESVVALQGNVAIDTLIFDINVVTVPEAKSIVIAMTALGAICLVAARRNFRSPMYSVGRHPRLSDAAAARLRAKQKCERWWCGLDFGLGVRARSATSGRTTSTNAARRCPLAANLRECGCERNRTRALVVDSARHGE